MRFVDDDLVAKWTDGSIGKRAKGEAKRKFHELIGKAETSNVFERIIARKREPTIDEMAAIREVIEEYWGFYNPDMKPVPPKRPPAPKDFPIPG